MASKAAREINRLMWGMAHREMRAIHGRALQPGLWAKVEANREKDLVRRLRVGSPEYRRAQMDLNQHRSELLRLARAEVREIAEENPLSHAMPKDFAVDWPSRPGQLHVHQTRFDRTVRYRDLAPNHPSLVGDHQLIAASEAMAGYPPSHERDVLDDLAEIEIPVPRVARVKLRPKVIPKPLPNDDDPVVLDLGMYGWATLPRWMAQDIKDPRPDELRVTDDLTGPWGKASDRTARRLPLMNFADADPHPASSC